MTVCGMFKWGQALSGLLAGLLLVACQAGPPGGELPPVNVARSPSIAIVASEVWGGEVRCLPVTGCRLALVEHEANAVVLHGLAGRLAKTLDRAKVAYHPDAARWLSDDLVAAAVEGSASIDIFRIVGEKLTKLQQIPIGFSPRDVMLIARDGGRYRLLATPYLGSDVAWVDWVDGDPSAAVKVQPQRLCHTPWHPRKVPAAPGGRGEGLVVGCLDDMQVVYVPGLVPGAEPVVLFRFESVPRNVVPSPSGRWWYVALETGGRNARIDALNGTVQWLNAPIWGAVSAAPLTDDVVVWGEDQRVFLQRYDDAGGVLETRTLPASGFPTGLQLIDADGDGVPDLVIYNSAGDRVDVHFGPIWDSASLLQAKK